MAIAERGARPARVKDVAQLAGVSVGTVSNVLNGRRSVGEEVRERVEAAIEELGFVRNATGRALRTGSFPMVGVSVLDLTNPFFMEAAAGMDRRLRQDGFVMALSSTHSDAGEEARTLRTFAGQGVRGVVVSPTDTDLAVAHEVAARGVPVVLFDSPATPDDMSSILADDRAGAAMAVEHLIGLGHRRILFLNGPAHQRQSHSRLAGVRDGIARSGEEISLSIEELGSFTATEGRAGVRRLLVGCGLAAPMGTDGILAPARPFTVEGLPEELPTAIFCANDLIAFGAMTALRDAGIRIPEDVSLVGFDDIEMAAQMSVPLTTIAQPTDELGWVAADMLLTEPVTVRHETLMPALVRRRSTAAPRG